MKIKFALSLIAALNITFAGLAIGADDYQVTGPVLELTDTMIAVQKGSERWEITRSATTKVSGDLKVGSKVTIHYTMTAKDIEVKGDKAADPKSEKASGKRKD